MPHRFELAEMIGDHLNETGCSRRELVQRMGYQNLGRGLSRLDRWIRAEEWPRHGQVSMLAQALGVETRRVAEAMARDAEAIRSEQKAQRAMDPRYYVTIRLIAGVYAMKYLDGDLSLEEAKEAASAEARRLHSEAVLQTPDSRCFRLNEDGDQIGEDSGPVPTTYIGGQAVRLNIG